MGPLPFASTPVSSKPSIEQRVVRVAEAALERNDYVAAIDVLAGIGWLHQAHIDEWRQGRLPHLEAGVQANLAKISTAMTAFRRWALHRGLVPSETAYVARTRDRRRLRFSVSGTPEIERAYRTHWVSPTLKHRARASLLERASRPPDLVVISPVREFTCSVCGGTGSLLFMDETGPLCLTCARLEHLVYLPRGNAALTRRAKQASALTAVVVRFSRTRKRYERQGILVEPAALEEATSEYRPDLE